LDSGKGFAQFCGHTGSGMSRSVSDLKQLFARSYYRDPRIGPSIGHNSGRRRQAIEITGAP
jgi:hypothetical protein